MLVITRKPNEVIRLSDGSSVIEVSIEGIQGNRIRIGIEAPDEVRVTRSEPCRVCGRPTFDYYLGYKDIPVCGRRECNEHIRENNKSLFQ